MPLMTVLHPERMADIVQTMLHIADEQGRLPVWHLWGNETDCMVGNPGIVAVADAIVKGIGGFDREKAFEAIRKTAMNPDRGNGLRMKYGYIPCEMFNEAVAYDMEYALADGAAARAAETLGKAEDAKYFEERSHSYRNYFDPATRFMRGRDSRKGWRTPFNAFASTHRADDYCEGNAWQYTWLAPHDVKGLEGLFGSRAKMIEKLDSLFTVSSVIEGGETSPDISGLIGQYAHGNEPSHHVLYLYTMLGQPWKTADKVREVLTTLYHDRPDGLSGNAVLFPRKFYEVTASGEIMHYSPYNGEVLPGYMYTDTGFWDTFRSLFPLLNLVYPSVNAEIQQGLANTARESGFLPEWASPGHRGCMVGNNSASVVADALLKGVTPEKEWQTLYEAMMHARTNVHPGVSSTGRLGHEYYNRLGYIPYDVKINENVARTLEYAYDDWCIAQVARKLGKTEDAAALEEASRNYRNVFDKTTKLMRGRNENGEFQSPFSPYKWGDAFTEGNSWHYTWSVFHDVQGLAELMGGREGFAEMLDSVFVVPPIYDDSYYGTRIHEITEMQVADMGNYAHGNQPAQHMIYLYNYAGQPWKAQYWTREVMDRLYSSKPDGYCGDEDNGQTSAWYVFSALGFYSVCPASDQYVIGSPLFRKATVKLENGKKIVIEAPDNAPENRYIGTMKLDGKRYDRNFIRWSDLVKGAKIDFVMQPDPAYKRGVGPQDAPYSLSRGECR